MATLPYSEYASVTGQMLLSAEDTNLDPDKFPDGLIPTGKVYLKPSFGGFLKFLAAGQAVFSRRFALTLDSEGYPTVNGSREIYIPPTDDPAGNPVNWTYTVSFDVKDPNGDPLPVESYSIAAPMGQIVNVFTAAPDADAEESYIQLGSREVGYAETQAAAQNTAYYDISAGAVPGLLLKVVGEGRPVEIEAFFGSVYRSSANTAAFPFISVNGNSLGGVSGTIFSPLTTNGPSAVVKRRIVLQRGVEYTFTAGVYGGDGDTNYINSTPYTPSYLSVVSR